MSEFVRLLLAGMVMVASRGKGSCGFDYVTGWTLGANRAGWVPVALLGGRWFSAGKWSDP